MNTMNILLFGRKFTFSDGTSRFHGDYLSVEGELISVDGERCNEHNGTEYRDELEGLLARQQLNRAFARDTLKEVTPYAWLIQPLKKPAQVLLILFLLMVAALFAFMLYLPDRYRDTPIGELPKAIFSTPKR